MSADTVSSNEENQVQEQEVVQNEQEPVEQQETQEVESKETVDSGESEKEQMIPLTALQKERKKRQEAEEKIRYFEQQQQSQQSEEDLYEAATKGDLGATRKDILRDVEERMWIRSNPDLARDVDENLTEFLKQRPHLALAIKESPNRYEEASILMNALSPRQKAALKMPPPAKKAAPNSPNSVPKAAGINQAVDVMSMNDKEYNEWRASKRKR